MIDAEVVVNRQKPRIDTRRRLAKRTNRRVDDAFVSREKAVSGILSGLLILRGRGTTVIAADVGAQGSAVIQSGETC